jgi:hypothetical protein
MWFVCRIFINNEKLIAMKPLQELKNRFEKFKIVQFLKTEKEQNIKPKTSFSKWFSLDDGLWY